MAVGGKKIPSTLKQDLKKTHNRKASLANPMISKQLSRNNESKTAN